MASERQEDNLTNRKESEETDQKGDTDIFGVQGVRKEGNADIMEIDQGVEPSKAFADININWVNFSDT